MKALAAAAAATLLFAGAALANVASDPPPPLDLNDARVGWTTSELQLQVAHSTHVLAFFQHHRRLLLPAQHTCRGILAPTIAWCERARAEVRAARWLHNLAAHRLVFARARDARYAAESRQREVVAQALREASVNPVAAIEYVFGPYASQALQVSRCESGYNVWATNGQYHGLFQMGSSERAIYGDAVDPLGQARAAYAYFTAAGHSWGPWACKPW